jgi:thiamine biosynthesis protein ThiS
MSSNITSSPAEVAVTVNGVARALATGSSLRDLIEVLGFAGRPIAVEVDGNVVPRAALATAPPSATVSDPSTSTARVRSASVAAASDPSRARARVTSVCSDACSDA